MKALNGIDGTLTYKDACKLGDQLLEEYLFALSLVIEEATDDAEERSDIIVNLGEMLTKLLNVHMTMGSLRDPDIWLDEIRSAFSEELGNDVKIELIEIEEEDDEEDV